jgi:hypothetical protein
MILNFTLIPTGKIIKIEILEKRKRLTVKITCSERGGGGLGSSSYDTLFVTRFGKGTFAKCLNNPRKSHRNGVGGVGGSQGHNCRIFLYQITS